MLFRSFSVLRGAQGKTWHKIHQEEDDAGPEEAVGEPGDGVRELISELDVMPVEPAAGDLGEAVEVGDVITVAVRSVRALIRLISIRYSRSEKSSQ